MEQLTRFLLILHVTAGSLALLAAIFAISFRKGATKHNLAGKTYFWSMMTVAVTAIPVSILRPNLMLFFVALFSSYMAYAGWRFGRKVRYIMKRKPYVEWTMLLVGVAMIVSGFIQVLTGTPMGWVLIAFGSIGLQFAVQDLRGWRKAEDFGTRISNHLSHMLGGTIATVTAVLVQQVVPRLESTSPFKVIVWLAPTVIITPLIVIWSRKVQATQKVSLFASKSPK
ncbi:MAG: hypothetical protein KGL77_03990 [Actinomycetales bacterium]|nr:hypothetical protein [Actinomycetales bacterium]